MHLALLSWLYGILAIASIFITAAMWRMGRERLDEHEKRAVRRPDVYFLVIFYAGLHGLGGVGFWTYRTWDALWNGQMNAGSIPVLALVVAIVYAIGKSGLVFASSINGKPLIWRLFLGAGLLWSAFLWWELWHFWPA